MNSYGDGNTYRGMVCKDSETQTLKAEAIRAETIDVDKDTLLNVTCWDWGRKIATLAGNMKQSNGGTKQHGGNGQPRKQGGRKPAYTS